MEKSLLYGKRRGRVQIGSESGDTLPKSVSGVEIGREGGDTLPKSMSKVDIGREKRYR